MPFIFFLSAARQFLPSFYTPVNMLCSSPRGSDKEHHELTY
ncbi:hypothetical protein HMPREF0201_01166 [Cedecea davisae DSM 4568]|uniref:Uncharacterized protein n=1 Tax=Cedecea davisae DSM 4568 TaxID=566551 RepID=S3JEC8_9ENTR|nr:hypothetical protein HMPREF0201_01166 [Cedecea davisae DSM 4568]